MFENFEKLLTSTEYIRILKNKNKSCKLAPKKVRE